MSESAHNRKNERDQALLKQGKKLYLQELAKQLANLELLLNEPAGRMSLAEAQNVYRIVHTMKGSAPIFGLIRIGDIAEKLVRLWEWASQDARDGSLSPEQLRSLWQSSSTAGQTHVFGLRLEKELYEREIELDELGENGSRSFQPQFDCRVLVIDDDDVLRGYLVRRLILDGYTVDEAGDVETAKRKLREQAYDLVTLDLLMYPQSGYELFEYMKEDPSLKWIPLVVLSGRADVRDKVRCFQLGADDYVTKPFDFDELSARIYSLIKRTKTFEQMAFRDPLTGAYNRRYFDHQVSMELQRLQRSPAPVSLVFIDIDRFKSVNDTYGHHIGDLVLQGLAHLLQQNLRHSDLLARFGGEEFVIVLLNSPLEESVKRIEHVLSLAHQGPIVQNEGHEYHITFSAGVSEWRPGLPLQQWIQEADDAMYTAKQQGRDRVLAYKNDTPEPSPEAAAAQAKRATVVVADDDPILRSIVAAKLQMLLVDVVEAEDGAQAVEKIGRSGADLLLLDAVMPELDGFGALRQIRESDTFAPGLKIIMLSGGDKEEDEAKAYKLGADGYMHKPFSMVELELYVKRLLQLE